MLGITNEINYAESLAHEEPQQRTVPHDSCCYMQQGQHSFHTHTFFLVICPKEVVTLGTQWVFQIKICSPGEWPTNPRVASSGLLQAPRPVAGDSL